jgi:tetratricopeptide (TPR) repeat protein
MIRIQVSHLAARRIACVLAIGTALAGAGPASAQEVGALNSRNGARAYSEGVWALDAGRFEQAATLLQQVSLDSPRNSDVWRFLGAARAGLKDWAGSRAAYEKAVEINPTDWGSHAGLGVALAALGDAGAKTELAWLEEQVRTCNRNCADFDYLDAMLRQVREALTGRPSPVL